MGFPCFSAIARSVMISAREPAPRLRIQPRFSAIARSVMISARDGALVSQIKLSFSAIARSVMISATHCSDVCFSFDLVSVL